MGIASTLLNHLEPQTSGEAKLQKIENLVAQLQEANSLRDNSTHELFPNFGTWFINICCGQQFQDAVWRQ
ncbi:hypothetical protein [Scytonema sp. NUACC26]|uniref:hypothetical protein n=1 Tax=Scytonema sp. NUACC26 TaxID=3140176 RepID=UPI0034DBB1E1